MRTLLAAMFVAYGLVIAIVLAFNLSPAVAAPIGFIAGGLAGAFAWAWDRDDMSR
jgi:hypothetical protein